jgi:hypothetical protein
MGPEPAVNLLKKYGDNEQIFDNISSYEIHSKIFAGVEDIDDPEAIIEFVEKIRKGRDQGWTPPQPSSDAYVWRYLNFTQLLSIIERDAIWFTHVNDFEDPYEGTIPKANLEKEIEEIKDEFDITHEKAVDIHDFIAGKNNSSVSEAYVNCWNVNAHQSAALWEQYVDSQQGIAIRTTVNNLINALDRSDRNLTFGNIEYIDYDNDAIPEGEIPTLYHKRESFEHEEEYRISYIPSKEDDVAKGFYVDVNTDILLDRIMISPIAPNWFSELVQKVLTQYNIDCEVRESGLYSDPDVSIK